MRSLWVPRREGAMSPGERFLVYGIWALIVFSLLPRSPVQPIGSPKEAPPIIFTAALFALLGFAAELRWFWRVLLGVLVGAPRVLVYIGHGALPANDVAGIVFFLAQPILCLLLVSFADPAPSMRRWLLSAPAGASRDARAAAYYVWAAVCITLVLAGAVSAVSAGSAVYELIRIWSNAAVEVGPYRLGAGYMLEQAKHRLISAIIMSGLLFAFVFGGAWARTLRKAWSKSE
jgi:hypothetical protein